MIEKKQKEDKPKDRNFMSRNVTEFRHLICQNYISESDLNWVINLRENHISSNTQPISSSPPDVYFKKTQSYANKYLKQDDQNDRAQKINPSQFDHMILKNEGSAKQTQQQLHFYSNLRKQNLRSNSSTLLKKTAQFSIYPYKDRKEVPKMIKKENIKKMQFLTNNDKESALDGAHNQQRYSQNILKRKNYGLLEPFTKIQGRNKVSLPSLAWQIGLRDY